MRTRLFSMIMLLLVGFGGYAQTLSGKEIFAGNCKACHSLGGGDIVGPDLAQVTERRDESWIREFITNSQKLVAAGDEQAVDLFNKYNKIAMPPHNFSEEEMDNLISYMAEAGREAAAAKTEEVVIEDTPVDVEVAAVETGGMNWALNALLGLLGVSAALLILLAGRLYGILKS